MDASRAATGMLEVLTTTMVRSMSGLAAPGVGEGRELLEQLRHLVAPLAAAHVDHDVHVGELGDGLLQDGLAGAEAAGEDGGPPRARGKRKSMVRWPVTSGRVGESFFR